MENGILTLDERVRLKKLLSKSQKYTFVDLPTLVEWDAKYFIATKEHLLNIYVRRFKNTNNIKVKSQLAWVVNNLTASLKSNLRVSIIGPEDDRIIIFSDIEMDALLGVVSKEDSSSVIEYTIPGT
ncbi:hypothetical protein [Dyadobacter sp. LHD-138]|uniref:hypothetical protein n=1 Tax=Dyadobacter sp. LHD-138 TaxID=3071413 RepID=UPI0027E1091F|nr:hypothetical protein [Dyadobacter sp. LHD-138]MDQ6479991.1 hypothetical protein [Dyadobacter sp. LHD-138]